MHSPSDDNTLHIASLDDESQQTAILLTVYAMVQGELESRISVEHLIPRLDLPRRDLGARLNDLSVRRWLEVAPGPAAVLDVPGLGRVEAILREGAAALPKPLQGLHQEAHLVFIDRNWEQFRLLRCVHRRVKGLSPPWTDLEEVMKELGMDDPTLDRVMRRCLAMDVLDFPESWSIRLTDLGLETSERWTKKLAQAEEQEPEGREDFEAILTMEWEGRYDAEPLVFKRQGNTWLLVYEGIQKTIQDTVGMGYIAYLLGDPDQELSALDLRDVVAKSNTIRGSHTGKVADDKAVAEYKLRLEQLREAIEDARAMSDTDQLERLAEEEDIILRSISSAIGTGGRRRKTGNIQELARQSVSVAIHRALDQIAAEHPPLGRHLRNSLTIGNFLSYHPDRPTHWVTGS